MFACKVASPACLGGHFFARNGDAVERDKGIGHERKADIAGFSGSFSEEQIRDLISWNGLTHK